MAESDKLIKNETEAIECLKSNKPTSGYVMLQESIDMAIKALEKQISKKVLNKKDGLFANCPNCGRVQNSVWNKTYCGDCGKKLDWSDEE